jgi:hypothetical protein
LKDECRERQAAAKRPPPGDGEISGGFFFLVLRLLDRHIAKFVGVEDFPAVEALDKFDIFLACHNADLGMLTDSIHGVIRAVRLVMGQIVPGQ